MCGICGILSPEASDHAASLRAMSRAQRHRGPDGEGFFLSGSPQGLFYDVDALPASPSRCALAHQRLAILDPSPAGRQPLCDPDQRAIVLLNGEIYNFREIRARLAAQGAPFRTDTDTEVLAHLYLEHPDEPARWLAELNGIFAIAIWDTAREKLLLARDPYGVKPLHLCQSGDRLLFASEIKALLAAGLRAQLNRAALHAFLNVRFVPNQDTLFAGVTRLPPGHFAWAGPGGLEPSQSYYTLPDASGGPTRDWRAPIRQRFEAAVERQLLSDVPVGMALSGGLDSSMIVAVASRLLGKDKDLRVADRLCRTFTLGFNEPTDENADAALVSRLFGTRHTDRKLELNPLAQARAVIRAVEEPKVNILQGYELARLVREQVKVLFGGLGGDELFAGYDIHRFGNVFGRLHRCCPAPLRAGLLRPLSRGLWHLQARSGHLKSEHYRIGAQILLSAGDRAQFYTRLRNAWDADPGMYARLYARPDDFRDLPKTAAAFAPWFATDQPFLEQMLRAEFQNKMVNDFLVNEDRVTSAHGVEGRVPFLDKDLVELAFRIPAADKMRGRETKALWKDAIGDDLPDAILHKKKQGFTFSSAHQWQKDLRAEVERELTETWCRDTGLFAYGFIRELLDYPPHKNLRWHYFTAWMMLGVKQWMEVFDVES